MKNIYLHLSFLLLLSNPIFAQFFTNASDHLPFSGATKQSMDIRAADLDNDGDLDVILPNEFQSNTILWNDGEGNFTDGTPNIFLSQSHDSEDVAIADFNGDGHLDLIFCSEDDEVHEFYLNDGTGNFEMADFSFPNSEANAVTIVDANQDNLPDVFFGNNGQNRIFINLGDGTFNEETSDRLPTFSDATQDANFADLDGDDDLDLFIGNETGISRLLINDGTGIFEDKSSDLLPQMPQMETRKVSFGDVDNDGDLDAFLSNVDFAPTGDNRQNRLLLNDGNALFTDATTQIPSDIDHSVDAIFLDTDMDGDMDIVVANVFGAKIKVYQNDGLGNFVEATTDIFDANYVRDALGVFAADFSGDGLLDIYICDRNTGSNNKDVLLFQNEPNAVNDIENEHKITIQPNPNNGNFSLILKETPTPISFELLDNTGKFMMNLNATNNDGKTYSFDLRNIDTAGVYLLKINFPKGNLTKKLVLKY